MALGLERAKLTHVALIEKDLYPSRTLSKNRPDWTIIRADVAAVDPTSFERIDVIAAGMPRPKPPSISRDGAMDDSLSSLLRFATSIQPKAILVENVATVGISRAHPWRNALNVNLRALGYDVLERIVGAADFGVPQNRQRYVAIAMRYDCYSVFHWPLPGRPVGGAGQLLSDLMSERGWRGADEWVRRAGTISPAIVGGSSERGGADLGPSRSRRAWADFGIDGRSIADEAPSDDFPPDSLPRLTNRMAAALQGFPESWVFEGPKTSVYRQIASASPPAMMYELGLSVQRALLYPG